MITTTATHTFCVSRRAVDDTWELKPKLAAHQAAYYLLLLSNITCASLIWWHNTKNKIAIRKLSKFQRLFCLGITGALTTTPKAVTEVLIDVPPLHLEVEAQAKLAAYELKIGSGKITWFGGWHTKKLL